MFYRRLGVVLYALRELTILLHYLASAPAAYVGLLIFAGGPVTLAGLLAGLQLVPDLSRYGR